MASLLATQLADHARDLIAKLRAMDVEGATVAGSKPNVSGGGFDTINHQEYRASLRSELMQVTDRLETMGVSLDESGNVITTTGVSYNQGLLGH